MTETVTVASEREPAWLAAYRQRNHAVCAEKPLKKSLYTNVKAWDVWLGGRAAASKPAEMRLEDVKGRVSVMGWREALAKKPAWVREALENEYPAKEQFEAFVNGGFSAGVVIEVPAQEELVSWTLRVPENAVVKNVVVFPGGGKANVLERVEGRDVVFSETVVVQEDANASLARVHLEEGKGLEYCQHVLGAQSRFQAMNLWLSPEDVRSNSVGYCRGNGSVVEQLDAALSSGAQKFDLNGIAVHEGTDTRSYAELKNVLLGKSVGNFEGMIKILPTGQRTNALLQAHSMMLSGDASSNNIPGLEIEADDVKATHSASVAHLEEEDLFYLMSRGLGEREAKEMIVVGFLGSVFRRLPPDFLGPLEAALASQWVKNLAQPKKG